MDNIEQLKAGLKDAVENAADLEALEAVRVKALGKKGRITGMMKTLGSLAAEERKEKGKALNLVKRDISEAIEARKTALEELALTVRLETEGVDVTLPVRPEHQGRVHPISQTLEEVMAVFGEMGFSLAEGPDVEDDFHNFTALNFPPDHPAREMHDTFFLPDGDDNGRYLLRTHTSPVQIRVMENTAPPIRVIAPGRTYRCDSDITHTPMFGQVEGLIVDTETNMAHLKGCLIEFVKAYFEMEDLPVRFRPSFFPFTEPSAEMDIGCSRKDGGLSIGAGDDWLEILGCGMVHPNVLKAGGIDPDVYQGFAFGMGLERIAMLKYGIPDLRTFFEADLRWLKHYGFVPLDVPGMTRGLSMTGGRAQ